MKRILSIFLSIMMLFTFFNVEPINVKAAGEHQFAIKAYDWNAFDNEGEGSGTGEELIQNSSVEPGKIIQIQLYYVPGANPTMLFQMHMRYDDTLVTPVYYDGEFYAEVDMSTTYQGGIWPAKSTLGTQKNQTNWTVSYNDAADSSKITCAAIDGQKTKPLVTEGTILTTYFKINENAPAGSVINFDFDEKNTLVDQSSGSNPSVYQNLTLTVFGEEKPESATLNQLSVKNGNTTYDLDPTFVADSNTQKEYNVVVPNHVTSIDIAASATDANANVSGIGTQTLSNIGNNDFDLVVTTSNGTTETYQLHVYRLNNDTTLTSLSLTNDIDIGTFNKDIRTYTATAPYKTTSTVVSASPTDANSEIISGTGTWDLTNYGDNINSRDIVVNAENCKPAYSNIPGNSCTSMPYTIKITRMAPSSNANLSDLSVDGKTVNSFTPGLQSYDLGNLPYETTKLNINAVVEDTGKAVIESTLGTKNLSVGSNEFQILVRAEDGTPKTYTITAYRLSNNSNLSSLNVTSDPAGQLTPTFKPGTKEGYTYTAPSTVKNVTITAEVEDIVDGQAKATIISGPGIYDIDTTPTVNILVQAEDGTNSTYVVNLVRSKSSNNNLKSLSIDGYTLNETFNPSIRNYTANVSGNVEEVNISAEVEDTGKATIKGGIGKKNLTVGSNNLVTVTVKAENGDEKEYYITITRAKKTVALLTDLKVDGVTVPDFNETTLPYTLNMVDFEKTSVNIEAIKKDVDSTIEIKNSDGVVSLDGNVNLNTGENQIYVTVTAQDGVTKTTYTINIERKKDSNNKLKDLKVNGVTIDGFTPEGPSFGITVENNITNLSDLNLEVIPESDYAFEPVISSDNEIFSTDTQNTIRITVTAEDGTPAIYKLYVTRKKSDNNYLKGISLSSGSLNEPFNKMKNDYTADVDRSVTEVTITAEAEDSNVTVEVNGPNTLNIGPNEYTITVTSESGKPNPYTVIINRKPSSNSYLSDLQVDGVTILGFEKTNQYYEITVPSTKQNITFDAVTEEVHATTEGTRYSESQKEFPLTSSEQTFTIRVTAEDGESTFEYYVTVKKEKSNNNLLSDLSIVQTEIKPAFTPTHKNYTATVPYSVTNIDIVAVLSDENTQKVVGDGNKVLETGMTPFTITVEAENGDTFDYTIEVTREKNNNAYLNNIVLSEGTLDPEFDSTEENYNIDVSNETNSISIKPYKQDSNARLEMYNNGNLISDSDNINLNTGDNKIVIIVTAEDETTTKTYNLNITRARSSDATLKSLSVAGGELNPVFKPGDPNYLNYEVVVPYEIDEFNVNYEASSDDVMDVSVSTDKSLDVGQNTKSITVTAEDGTVLTYTITITRQPSTNNFLSSLSVKDINNNEYILNFDKTGVTPYDITVENEINEIVISAEVEDNTSTITSDSKIGSQVVKNGNNKYEIVVESASHIQRTYTINVFRKANSNNYLSSLSVKDKNNKEYITDFDKINDTYTINVVSDINKVIINANTEVSTSTVIGKDFTLGEEVTLKTGENRFDVIVTAENSEERPYHIIITKEASSNNYLSSLTVSPGTLDKEFSKEQLEYNVNVDNSTKLLTIEATKEDPNAQDPTGTGLKSINVGTQTFEITVVAENGEPRTYTINVTREASSVKLLKTLTITPGELSPVFDKTTYKYNVNVDNSVTEMDVYAEVLDETSSISSKPIYNEKISLPTGSKEIQIVVTAEDGTTQLYTITVTREKSNNNYLSSLTAKEGSFTEEFDKATTRYFMTVPYEVTSLNLNYELEDITAEVSSIEGNSNFVVGEENKVTINVRAENGEIKPYEIIVTRQEEANNFLTGIVVTGTDGTNYSLSEEFKKDVLSYNIEIPESVSEVKITVTKEVDSLDVKGDGPLLITSLPQEQEIIVSTKGGLKRTYKLTFKRGLSSNNLLKNLYVDKGTLTPSFTEDNSDYSVNLPKGTTEITVTAVKGEEHQDITGAGVQSLNPGPNTINVTVTSEDGTPRVYTIKAYVQTSDNDNVLSSLEVDKGTLDPAFDPEKTEYSVELDETEESINITATGDNSITGTGTCELEMGNNVCEVVSTDKDGNENKYIIVVSRGDVVSPYLEYLAIDDYKMNEKFDKETEGYSANIFDEINELKVIAIPKDKNADVKITGNTNMTFGLNTIDIVVTDENSNSKHYYINVNIGNTKITSNIHNIDDKYITTIEENKKSSEIKDEMTNPNEYLKIYGLDGIEISNDDIVGTGYVIKLEINGTVYDSKILIIKGDTNGDGEVGVADIIKIRLHILETTKLTEIESKAADTNLDDDIGVADIVKIRSHILGNSNLYSKEVK